MESPHLDEIYLDKEFDAERGKFIVEKAEALLQGHIQDREQLQKKAQFILGILAAAIALITGELLKEDSFVASTYGVFLFVELLILIANAVLLIWKCLMPSNYSGIGAEPLSMLRPDFADLPLPSMLVNYCYHLQKRIMRNSNQNGFTADWIRGIAIASVVSPAVAFLLGSLVNCLSHS